MWNGSTTPPGFQFKVVAILTQFRINLGLFFSKMMGLVQPTKFSRDIQVVNEPQRPPRSPAYQLRSPKPQSGWAFLPDSLWFIPGVKIVGLCSSGWVQIIFKGSLPTQNAHSRLFQEIKAVLCQNQVLILYLKLLKYYH